jgi:hypothetical protein
MTLGSTRCVQAGTVRRAALCGLLLAPAVLAGPARHLELSVREPSPARVGNCMPARVALDFRTLLGAADARIDPQSLRLRPLDAAGRPAGGPVPVRFDDPDPKPDSFYWAYIGGGGQVGDLVFQHRQGPNETTRYLLEYSPWDPANGTVPQSPAPQIGDYDILRYNSGGPMSGIFQTKITVCDLDGDGWPDILAGDQMGRITFYRRLGADPFKFDVPRLLEAGGKPLRVNWMCAPDAIDLDGDGDLDLITSDETSGLFVIENTGSRTSPRLTAPRPIADASGQLIRSPFKPVAEMSFFKKDYAPTPIMFDYDGDGRADLLFGGYVTGQIYYYQNVSASPKGPMSLEGRGALEDDGGRPIDVTWCAAPFFADLDDDGLPDLVSGHIAEEKSRFGWKAEPSLLFWKNTGTRSRPAWTRADLGFPSHWSDTPPDVTVPRVVDWNGDGRLDILMSGGCEIFYFENVGTPGQPRFEFRRRLNMRNGPLLLCPRFNAIAPAFGDLDGDGLPDLISGGSGDVPWSHMVAVDNAPRFEWRGYLQADGRRIYHEFRHGDDTTFPYVIDWDRDGRSDILMGDGDGYLTVYRNTGSRFEPAFASQGRLLLTSGKPLCAGEPTPDRVSDFEGHSGNRSVPAPADYDGDGDLDLICGNAWGDIFFYRNAGGGRFSPGIRIASGENRAWTCPVDWDRDGKPDVILSWSGKPRTVYLNRGIDDHGVPRFEIVEIKGMPWIPHPRPFAIDWDRDGDDDIVWCSSYSVLHFASRDFIEHGYLEAVVDNTP